MAVISKERALEAYNLIRYYCRQECDCEHCLFGLVHHYGCIFDTEVIEGPSKWPELELD